MNEVTRESYAKLSVDAVTLLMNNLASSDFPLRCGDLTVGELRKYGADICCDLFKTFTGLDPSIVEAKLFIQAFPGEQRGRALARPTSQAEDLRTALVFCASR